MELSAEQKERKISLFSNINKIQDQPKRREL